MTLAEVAAATGGSLVPADAGQIAVDGPVVSDSRQAGPGSLYVARIGEFADGHRYAGAAAEAGAVATLGSRAIEGMPTVVVADVQDAFAALGRAVVDRAPALRIVGITGSSGKTSTKDMLGQVLSRVGETISPEGSLNSEVGVPLTVCRVTPTTDYLVAEMGATGVGHIAYLTRIAPPTVGIVLNVGRAHVGEFGSVDAIARTKAELVEALPADGLAVLNADDPRVRAMRDRTDARVLLVGRSPDADLRATEVRLDPLGRASFTLVGAGDPRPVQLAVHGEHHVGNALAVIGAAIELGVPVAQAISALADARALSRWRMEVHELDSGATLINDAYNANPDSMTAALRALQAMAGGRHTVAVLGEMRELGEDSEAEHQAIGELVRELGIDRLVTVGAGAAAIGRGADGIPTEQVADVDAAYALLRDSLGPGDVVLLKSSRDSGLRYLGDRMAFGDQEVGS
ncbi:UDP-N-acetylmuramoyl-tripeptide--D-alanyl-D-alanine ligase [Metallococcus carri]|nr:UDP-N-acetylmuramoyl-tripeptide--D-alanyl-D-alanine ligase [Metallococcus carri]